MSEPITVVDWISDHEASIKDQSVGGLGGWFGHDRNAEGAQMWNAGHRWKDYIEVWKEDRKPYIEAIRASVLERGLRITGEQHQNLEDGVPLFSDGTVGTFSFRGWGDLMAAIWSEKEDKNYNYMDFYM